MPGARKEWEQRGWPQSFAAPLHTTDGVFYHVFPPPPTQQWLAPITCYWYPFFCGLCAAADAAEDLEPGSWCCYCLQLCLLGCLPCGACLQMRCIFSTRELLAKKYNVAEEPVGHCPHTFCEGLVCTSCYVGQTLKHIADVKGGESGADKLAAVV